MAVLKEAAIPIGRTLFVTKPGEMSKDDIIIEATGQYQVAERPDCFVIKNAECCRSITVKVKTRED
ncbi:MAG: hypothetical protein QHH05_01920 [Syntrophomonadaceae bacterium]|jgi:hypothetical protein|nr:hypothetical protein [Syntrophomonadaceae bacterium]MDH7497193.1 hypothetical protein [Syntrophomonadaceae bacterium]